MFVSNLKILGRVVPQKSLMEKNYTDRQMDKQTQVMEKTITIYPIYTSYAGVGGGWGGGEQKKKLHTDRRTNRQTCYGKDNNYISHIYFVCGWGGRGWGVVV